MKSTHAAILAIGDEILIGQITDTNSVFLAEQLSLTGIRVNEIQTVGDSREQIFDALDCALQKNEIVLMTGGLGPTEDDMTKEVLTEYFNTELELNKEVLSDVERFITSRNLKANKRNRAQAMVPRSCEVIRNDNGTAPGMWFDHGGKVVISMPAVPFEMKDMFVDKVLPKLKKSFDLPIIMHRTVLTHGIPESHLAELLSEWETDLPAEIKLAYLPSPERVRLRLSIECKDSRKTEKIFEEETQKLYKIIGSAIYGEGDHFLEHSLFYLLKKRNQTMATAESCTGGTIAAKITSVPGSSAVFKGGIVAYSNELKINALGVSAELIKTHGAVSSEVAKAMARGALEKIKSDYAVAVTGIAGPDGGTEEKPVGTVWIAVADKDTVQAKRFQFGKRRDINVRRSASAAMNMLHKLLRWNNT